MQDLPSPSAVKTNARHPTNEATTKLKINVIVSCNINMSCVDKIYALQ